MRRVRLIGFFCLACFALAQGILDSGLRAQPPPKRVTVTGKVVEAGTDQPAAEVTVMLAPKDGQEGEGAQGMTDEQGQFSLEDVAEGAYDLSLESPNHRPYAQELKVILGMEPLALTVKRLPRIRGQLRQPDGNPLANMQMDAQYTRLEPDGGWPEERSVTTDGEGRYEVPVQQPGRYLLTIRVPAMGYARSEVKVSEQDVEGVDLQLAPGASWAGRVRIRGTDEGPQQVGLALQERDGSVVRSSYYLLADEEGRFLLQNLPPGNYLVSAYGEGLLRSSPQSLTLVEGQAVTDFLVEVSPAPVLSGRLLAPDGASLAGQELEFQAYTQKETYSYYDWGTSRLTLDENSRFTIQATEEGPAQIFIQLADVGYLIQKLEVQAGVDLVGLEWQLKPFLTVTGQVREKRTQQPLPEIQVSLWRQSQAPGFPGPSPATSGADGRFELQGLIEGEYRVFFNTPGYKYYGDQWIRVAPGARPEELILELERGTPVAGRVLGPDGQTPLAGARVFFSQELERITDAEGRFAFESVTWEELLRVQAEGFAGASHLAHPAPGSPTGTLVVQAEGFAGASHLVWLAGADHPVEVNLIMRYRGGTITGQVRYAETGQPVTGGVVWAFEPGASPWGGGDLFGYYLQEMAFEARPPGPGIDFNEWPWQQLKGMPLSEIDAEGHYQLTHVGEGEYTLYAVVPGQGWAQCENVVVREGQTTLGVDLQIVTRQARPASGRRIAGTLTDPDGKPLANVRVDFQVSVATNGFGSSSQTDSDGRYTVDLTSWSHPGSGPYTLLVKAQGFRASKREQIEIGEGGAANVDFQLQPQSFGILAGQVFLPDGQTPAAGVWVFPVLPGRTWLDPTVTQSTAFLHGEPLVANMSQARVTDAAGRFRIERLETGDYRALAVPRLSSSAYGLGDLAVEAPDPRLDQASSVLSGAVSVPENGVGEVRLILEPAGRIEGVVRSAEDGQPLPDVSVSVYPREGQRFHFEGEPTTACTDAAGRFQIQGLSAGTYFLWTSTAGRMQAGKEVQVEAGGTASVELKMWAWRPATVVGRVLLPDGQTPAPLAYLGLSGRFGFVEMDLGRTDPEGRFELPIAYPDRLRVMARKIGYGRAVSEWFNLMPGSARRDLTLILPEVGAISGQIGWAEGSEDGREEVVVVAVPADQSLAEIRPSQQGDRGACFAYRRARPDENGRFTLTDVTAGLNTLAVFVKDVPRLVQRDVVVPAGGTGEGLNLTLPPARGRLTGRVLAAEGDMPLRGAKLTLFNEVLGTGRLGAQTDDQGRYSFSGIPAGSYRLLVTAPERANQVSAEFRLGEEPVTGLDFRLSAGGRIAGTVLGPDGQLVMSAVVSTTSLETDWPIIPAGLSIQAASVQEDGSFTLGPLAPGEYTLYFSAPGCSEARQEHVVVREGETTAGVNGTLAIEGQEEERNQK